MLVEFKQIDLAAKLVVARMLANSGVAPSDTVVQCLRAAYVYDQGVELDGADITDETMATVLTRAGEIAADLIEDRDLNQAAPAAALAPEERFDKFFRSQHPFRPSGPDQDRLRQVVEFIEDAKQRRLDPSQLYARFMDVFAVSYLAVQRAALDRPRSVPRDYHTEVVDFASNAWVEGFLFGQLFERIGGHRGAEGE